MVTQRMADVTDICGSEKRVAGAEVSEKGFELPRDARKRTAVGAGTWFQLQRDVVRR
jgi:hypothetical protein